MELELIKIWANENAGIIALVACLLTFIGIASSFIYKLKQRKNEKPQNLRSRLARNKNRQKEFSEYIEDTYAKYGDIDRAIIIRDFWRIEQYPKAKTGKGISPTFKVWLVNTYYNGIMVSLGMGEITYIKAVEDNTNWYYCEDDDSNEKKVFLVGKVPYDRIEEINWQGDEWNDYYPQVFCRFDSKSNEPYEELVYCERIEREGLWAYYHEEVKLQDMRNERVC